MKKFTALMLFLVTLFIYSLTTSPYLQAGDSGEMAASSISLGVPHQPSYPLYILFNHLVTLLPIPYLPRYFNFAEIPKYDISQTSPNMIKVYRSGISSALFQSLAALFLFLTIIELSKKIKLKQTFSVYLVATTLTFLYSFSETIWQYATKPEVFALNNLFACTILYLSTRWWNESKTSKLKAKFFLLFGVALVHHQTIIFIIPALLVIYFLRRKEMGTKTSRILTTWMNYPFDRKFNKLFPLVFCSSIGLVIFAVSLQYISSTKPFINWGEVGNLIDVMRAILRTDYGTFSAYLTNIANPTIRINQLPFFFNHLVDDFSAIILILSAISLFIAYKYQKNLFLFVTTLFLFTGPIFLIYANFTLADAFSQATVARFYMLPSIAIPLILSVGAFKLLELLNKSLENEKAEYIILGKIILAIIPVALTIQAAKPNIPVYNDLTYQFVLIAINHTEDNAMILVTGDITTMGMQYLQGVEGLKKQRIIFSPGQLHLDWIKEQLKVRYPSLIIPPPQKNKQFTSPRQIIEANLSKQPIYISTEFVDIDPSIQEKYILWPKGFLLKVEEKGANYKLEQYIEENNELYGKINLTDIEKIRSQKYQLETPLISIYSRHFYNLGAVFYSVHKYQDAIREFNRALTIDPQSADAYKALASILYFTDDYQSKQPQLALNYLDKYLRLSKNLTVEDYNKTQSMIQKIESDAKASMVEEQKQATSSSQKANTDNVPELNTSKTPDASSSEKLPDK